MMRIDDWIKLNELKLFLENYWIVDNEERVELLSQIDRSDFWRIIEYKVTQFYLS